MPYRDLRDFLEYLKKRGELKTCSKEVDSEIEIAKVTHRASTTGGPAILFRRVKGFEASVVTGLFGTIDRGFLSIESNKYEGFRKMARALEYPIPIRIVNDGPCREIVKTEGRIDLFEIPALHHHRKDSHRFITTGNCRVKDPDTGKSNSSINRVAVQGKNRLSINSNPPHQLAIIARKYLDRGKPCPFAVAIGTDPAIIVASVCGIPPGMDEFEFAGGLRGEAVEVVKCITVDIDVPAAAELVIEGEILPGDQDGSVGRTSYALEAPFGEIHGYFGNQVRSPIIHVTAITHRKDYIFHGLATAEHSSEHQILDGIGMQGDVYDSIKDLIPRENIRAINAGSFAAVVSIKKNRSGQGRQLIHNLLARAGLKKVIIVDEDIDVFNLAEVDWAVQFRSCGEDYIITPELPAINLDPMICTPPNLLKKVGIDATLPYEGDKKGRVEILRELGPARYEDIGEINLDDYFDG
ncbi:MAG: UbiD family decarboxylase [Deltaproteobacteria bacterium]|nr:UbiD family decarboxylase [Deltaproteobacteria bacterium]